MFVTEDENLVLKTRIRQKRSKMGQMLQVKLLKK